MRKFKQLISIAVVLVVSCTIALGQSQRHSATKVSNPAVDQSKTPESLVINLNQTQTGPDFSTSGAKGLLFDNGPFVTDPGAGVGGADVSILSLTNFGFGHSIASGYTVAEDVTINATSWTIDSLVFYAYQTGSTLTTTFTDYHVQIWNGNPSSGGTIVWGDLTTNVLSSSVFSNCYRAQDLTTTTRPIMKNTVIISGGLTLNGGTYWIEWQAAGSLASGPWANPITITGTPTTGNAIQFNGTTWAGIVDGTDPQGLPFQVYGTEVAATCPFPTALTATNITELSADLGWTEGGTATTWNIEWGANGFTQGTGTTVSGLTAIPYSLTGLTAGTQYDFYVQSDCGGGNLSLWAGPFSFTTLACAVASQCNYAFIYTDQYGDGWNGASITVNQNGVNTGTYTLAAGATGSDNVPICDGATVQLTFNGGSWDAECGFTLQDPFAATLTSFAEGSAPAAGTMFYTFTASCTPPACPWPTAQTVSSITLTSAILGWTNGGTETAWNIEYGPAGFTQGTGTVVPVTTNPYTLNGLTAGTSYEFYVQADCGGTTSNWTGPLAFNTLCNPVTVFPYSEGFETASMPPACWSSNDNDGDGSNWELRDAISGWRVYAGNQVAVSASWEGAPLTPDNYLISPQFVISAANLECKFWVAAQDIAYAGEHYSVMVSTTNTLPASFTEVFQETLSDTIYHQVTVPLTAYNGQSIYIAIRHWNVTDMYYMSLDEFSVDYATGMKENIESSISVYPNPSYNTLFISNSHNPIVTIYNNLGDVVLSSNKKAVDVSKLAEGLYFVKVIDNNTTYTKQINILK